jgi:hypothetical protein
VSCQAKMKSHSTQFIAILRDSGDEPDSAKTGKAPNLRHRLHQENKTKTKQNVRKGWMTETTMMSEQRLIPWVMAGGVGFL